MVSNPSKVKLTNPDFEGDLSGKVKIQVMAVG